MSRLPIARLSSLAALAALAAAGVLSTSATSSAVSAPQPSHTVTVGGVALEVPTSWHVATSKDAGPGCIVATGVTAPAKDKVFGVDDCQLRVLSGSQLGSGSRFSSPDRVLLRRAG